jgi:hypothetical protein
MGDHPSSKHRWDRLNLATQQSTSETRRRFWVPAAATVLLLGPAAYLGGQWFSGTVDLAYYAKEWGLLEVLHSLLTAIAAVLFYLSWKRGHGPVRVAGGALALLAAAAFVREIDLELITKALGWHWLVWLGEHGLQEIALIAMTLPIFGYLYVNRGQFVNLIKLGLRWQAWALYVSGSLVLL